MSANPINTAIAGLLRRAEDEDPATLAETFVDVNTLFASLSSRDSQVVYGRRGTGKTHALKYLTETLRTKGETVIYLDLRLLGSSGGIYADAGISVEEAGTRLLIDVLQTIYDELVEQAFALTGDQSEGTDLLLTRLDALSNSLGKVDIVGETEQRESASSGVSRGSELGIEAPRLGAFARVHEGQRLAAEREVVMRGVARHRVHFGSVGTALRKLVPALPGKRLWVIMDEWSHVPLRLQPLLADLIRHCLLPVPGVTVKFAAIETRSVFKLDQTDGQYLGIELGADVTADIDLDEFMVFSSGGGTATEFFAQLFFRHIQAAANGGDLGFESPEAFVDAAFAGKGAFNDLVRAAEGVPRDGINVLSKAAMQAAGSRISLRNVRDAAKNWYLTDKQAYLRTRPAERDFIHWIVDHVIGDRGIRGFLLRQGAESHLVEHLYDARLVHLIKRGIGSKDQAGVRFDAYAVDFGCYVDLLATRGAGPRGLLRADDEDEPAVPDDDLEKIRGAILDLDAFATSSAEGSPRREPPEVSLRGHAKEGSMTVESPMALKDENPNSEWYILVEARHGIEAVPLKSRPIRIGSSSNDQIRIRAESVVPRHAVIELAGDEPVLTADEGSIYVNELKVATRRVEHRDFVSIGEAELLIVSASSAVVSEKA